MVEQTPQPKTAMAPADAAALVEREAVAARGHPIMPPPPARAPAGGPGAWVRKNLFGSVKDTIFTIVFGTLLLYLAYRTFVYVFISGRWEVVSEGPLFVYMVGNRFGESTVTYAHVWAAIYIVAVVAGLIAGVSRANGNVTSRSTAMKILIAPIIGVVAILAMTRTITPTLLVLGAAAVFAVTRWLTPKLPNAVLRRAGWISIVLTVVAYLVLMNFEPSNIDRFGGLLLTIVVSVGGIALSFPLGVLLALARRSSFPLIRPLAVTYIELIRGVPLITLLFMGRFAFGFFLPPGSRSPGVVTRAIIMITLFTAAYVAEVVRGGLQSVPRGQLEGAQSLGLSPLKTTRLIVLPQALRNSIPALIGQFISLLKDTSLLVVVGLQELLGVTEPILAQLRFKAQGYQPETFAFVCLIYWVICFSMSRASQRLETRLGVGTR
jgi:general L-amino acid transport system permease protein